MRRLLLRCTAAMALAGAMVLGPDGVRVAAAQSICVADCNGDGAVFVNELVSAVSIALGVAAPSLCPGADANGDGQVTIAELVDAVSDALYGCGVTPPTPPPTRTPTTTPTATSVPTATATTGVDVSGRWRSDQLRVTSSSCPEQVTQVVRNEIRAGLFNCQFDVAQQGAMADVFVQCPDDDGFSTTGAVDPAGQLTFAFTNQDEEDGCRYTTTDTVTGDLSHSPTEISATFDYDFQPECGIADCRVAIAGRLRRVDGVGR
jgi:hypothetical protein